ncbi:unnamed protein product, partial [Medioppia subpectinata]
MAKTYKRLVIVKRTTNFREAVKVLCEPLVPPQDNEILVKTVYAGVNATDVITYQFGGNGVGYEALGVIEAVGKNVADFTVGQTVIFLFGIDYNFRGFSEYIYAKSEELTAVPCLKPELLSLPVCGITAAIGLDNAGFIKKTDKVLVTAAAGGTGMVAVQWAKQKGCYVIGMTSTEEKAKLLKELGTDRVINYKTENLDEVLTKEFPEGVDVIWETIGGQVFETLFKHLALKGRLVLIGGTASYKSETNDVNNTLNIPNASNLLRMNQMLSGFFIWHNRDLFPKYMPQLVEDVVSNKLKIAVDLGLNTSEGEFKGIDSVVRGVEVNINEIKCLNI